MPRTIKVFEKIVVRGLWRSKNKVAFAIMIAVQTPVITLLIIRV